MADDSLGPTATFEAIYRGTRDATVSILSGVMWALLGVFGVGLLWMAANAIVNGTGSPAMFFFAFFGAVITVLAGHEFLYRLLGVLPIV